MQTIFQILGHLNPLDVLRLARTTKQFRSMLMHKSSRFIWIAARKNVPDLPDCPPYMSEPQFANLVFDTHCHVRISLYRRLQTPNVHAKECLAPNTRSVDWRISRRICMKCTKEWWVIFILCQCYYPQTSFSFVEDYPVFSGESVYKAVPSKEGSE